MKILLTTDSYKPTINGVVISIDTLQKELEKLGHEVKVLTLAERAHINQDGDVYRTPSYSAGKIYPGLRFTLSTDDSIYLDILAWGPDIIHAHCEFSTFWMSKQFAKKLNIPIVHTYHTVYEDYTHYFSPNKKIGKKLISIYSKYILNQVESVIAPTEKVKKLLESYEVEQPIHVIPTGIQLKKFQEPLSPSKNTELKAKHDIPEENILCVFVGRLAKEKNLTEIFKYLAKMKIENVSFLVVGDGPYRFHLESTVDRLNLNDVVSFTGMIDQNEIANYYKIGDIFLNASTSETQGLTYIEALSSGLPLLCRHDEALEDVLINNVNGYQYQTYEEFKNYFLQLITNESIRKQMGDKAAKVAHQRYSAETFAKRVEKIYDDSLLTFNEKKKGNRYDDESSFKEIMKYRN